jgi:hypothetical protein
MQTFTIDQGEYARIGVDYSTNAAPWDDLAGATVQLVAKLTLSGSAAFTASGSLDAPGSSGKVTTCGVDIPLTAPAGDYYVTVTVDKSGQPGWPQHEQTRLKIRQHA